MTEQQLVPIKKKIEIVANQVKLFKITDQATLTIAVEMLSHLNRYGDSVKEKKELLTKPLNEALKNARSMFKPVEELYTEAIEALRAKMGQYQTLQAKLKALEEAKIAARVKEGKGNLSLETAVKKIEGLKPVEKEIATEAGLVQFRETKVLKLVDAGLIPREYLVVNERMVLEALKAGKVVAGAELETIQVPVNYR